MLINLQLYACLHCSFDCSTCLIFDSKILFPMLLYSSCCLLGLDVSLLLWIGGLSQYCWRWCMLQYVIYLYIDGMCTCICCFNLYGRWSHLLWQEHYCWYWRCCHCKLVIVFFGVWTSLTRWVLYVYGCLWVTLKLNINMHSFHFTISAKVFSDFESINIPTRSIDALFVSHHAEVVINVDFSWFSYLIFFHGKFCGQLFR